LGGIDVIPLCINEKKVERLVEIVEMLSPIFSAINLEDIKVAIKIKEQNLLKIKNSILNLGSRVFLS
jgi:malic enzyme